jgi:hypothetical protein
MADIGAVPQNPMGDVVLTTKGGLPVLNESWTRFKEQDAGEGIFWGFSKLGSHMTWGHIFGHSVGHAL